VESIEVVPPKKRLLAATAHTLRKSRSFESTYPPGNWQSTCKSMDGRLLSFREGFLAGYDVSLGFVAGSFRVE